MTKKKAIVALSFACLTLALLGSPMINDYLDDFFPLNNVQVEAPFVYVSKQTIEQQLTPFMKKGLLHINKNAITKNLSTLPWVKQVQVKRVYPDTLFINLTESQPVAIFNENDLLDDRGIRSPLIQDVHLPLPKLKGNAGSEKELLQELKKVSKLLKAANLIVDRLERESTILILTMSNGLKIIVDEKGAQDRLARFVKVYPQLLQKKTQPLAQVDLRYKHGLAVKWKPPGTIDS